MQNAGQPYGQGGTCSHPGAPYGHADTSSNNPTTSITTSLRQFRKKDADKQQQSNDNTNSTTDSHVARVAPHNHYPPSRPTEYPFRYPPQCQDYSVPSQVKFSEISDQPQALQDQMSPSVIQKAKGKEYMEMCNVQQSHPMKHGFPDHLSNQQSYVPDAGIQPHTQYLHKDHQVHPPYKPESQYFPKEPQYQQLPPQIQKYNMPPAAQALRKYTAENDFLSKLRRIHPSMARSIMSDHHMQESQPSYQMDQNRMYPHQNQRYMNYPTSMQNGHYPHGYMPTQHYGNYPASCNYNRPSQMAPRFPPVNPHERSISPRRAYTDNLPMPPMNYAPLPQKISPNYPQYNPPEYAQHYQHRRPTLPSQDYYQQHCRPAPQYLPHQMTPQEMSDNSRVTVSDNIKQYIENWADEDTASEMNQMENNRMCKETLRVRDDQSTETVYMINASELQYLENGIPLVASENGIPLVASENGQYILKSGVSIDNSTGMVRIVDKGVNHSEHAETSTADRVVNLHIMDSLKPDCMLANKPNDVNQRNDTLYSSNDKPRVVIHQNTVIQPGQPPVDQQNKIGNSLPVITDSTVAADQNILEKFDETIFKPCKKETVDKNCSPINPEQIEEMDIVNQTSVICPTNTEDKTEHDPETSLKNMPLIDLLPEIVGNNAQESTTDEEIPPTLTEIKEEQQIEEEKSPKVEGNSDNVEEKVALKEDKVLEEDNKTVSEEKVTKNEETVQTEPNSDSKEHNPSKETQNSDNNEKIAAVDEDSTKTVEEDAEKQSEENIETDTALEEEQHIPDPSEPRDIKIDTIPKKEEQPETLTPLVEEQTTVDQTTEDVNMVTPTTEDNSSKCEVDKEETKETGEKISAISDVVSSRIPEEKPSVKRCKRIFSVDDIINNIGNNVNKTQSDKRLAERRYSLQMTREFLEREVEGSKVFRAKDEEPKVEKPTEVKEDEERVKKKAEDIQIEAIEEKKEVEETKEVPKAVVDVETKEEKLENISSEAMETKCDVNSNITDEVITLVENKEEDAKETRTEDPKESLDSDKDKIASDVAPANPSEDSGIGAKQAAAEVIPQNEVHYRNAIRVDENNVLLQIAGELVEISVNNVNGKKIITVIPLSDTVVVDFNDNYETAETMDSDRFKDVIETEIDDSVVQNTVQEFVPEPDMLESTSEIIIGMDISLEEEIHLDLEKPPICTKAAKKCYENDLQIPSITTSEDINDTSVTSNYSINDKVSSSKEQEKKEKTVKKKKTDTEITKSKNSPQKHEENDKKVSLRELMKVRKIKKDKQKPIEEEEDFVPFKDLVKARKMKKMKQMQLKVNEGVSADSTNKVDQENSESESKKCKIEAKIEEVKKDKTVQSEKSKEHGAKVQKKLKIEENKDEDLKNKDETSKINNSKENCNKVTDKKEKEKVVKKVSFGSVNYEEPAILSTEKPKSEIKNYRLEDPRLKSRSVIVPSVSELLKESEGTESPKKKLSLEEYNNRKRKLSLDKEEDYKSKKAHIETKKVQEEVKPSAEVKSNFLVAERLEKYKMQRPKSLDDLKVPGKPKEGVMSKRKLSLEEAAFKPNYFDWEETQSPKTNLSRLEHTDRRHSEFSGLINNNKSNIVVDINDLSAKPTPSDNSEDEILQTYKVQVDSKLNSLNIQIPRVAKPHNNVFNPFSKPDTTNNLMQRFLKNEKLTHEEMERIKTIISYKRLVQQLKQIKSPDLVHSPLNPTYEIRKHCSQKDMKLHLKKVSEKKKKNRFRNLHTDLVSESESDFSETKKAPGDYSVVQSNCFAAGVPKLIIKRKTEMQVPIVRLERLDLEVLVDKKRKIY